MDFLPVFRFYKTFFTKCPGAGNASIKFLIRIKRGLTFLDNYFLIHKCKERYNIVKRFLLIFIILLSIHNLPAQRAYIPWANGNSAANDLQFYLVTFSPGDNLTDWFGHTALIVKDSSRNVARIYNYGLFSFDEGFISRFAMGRLIFFAGDAGVSGTLRRYKKENRTIRIQQLNIPLKKRRGLAKKLADSVLPQNRAYLYDHYYNNCSTRLRDYFDQAVNGQFHIATDSTARFTLREETMRYTAQQPLMQWVLLFLMNDSIDKPIKQWDEMFLPDELARFVETFRYRTETGSLKPFVKTNQIYYDAHRAPVPVTINPYPLWPLWLGLLIAVLASGIFRSKFRRLFWAFGSFITLPAGLLGSILFFMMLFTNHTVTYHNENLFLINPLTLILFFLNLAMLFRPRPKLAHVIARFWYAQAFLTASLLFLKLIPIFDQQNSMALFLLVPVNFTFAVLFYFSSEGQVMYEQAGKLL